MLANSIITEQWLADVLQDSLEMDWTSTDGARAIMRALEAGAVALPQSGGQVVAPSHTFLCGSLDNYPCDCAPTFATQLSQEGEGNKNCVLLLESLCAWLLHRFGPETPEGREASFRYVKAREALAVAPTPPTLSEDLREALGRVVRSDQVRDWRAKCDNPTSTSDWVWRDGRYVIIDWAYLMEQEPQQ